MNQENTSENTVDTVEIVENIEANPTEGENFQDENDKSEEIVNNVPITENETQLNENKDQVNENENQINEENENQFNESENQVNGENQLIENQSDENGAQIDENVTENENEIQSCPAEAEIPLEGIPGEEAVVEQNFESTEEPEPISECNLEEKSLIADADTSSKAEDDSNVEQEIQGADSQQKDKTNRNQKRGNKNANNVNCDKYGWPIGSKYCTEVNDSSSDVNFTEDVDLANCEGKIKVDNNASLEAPLPDEEILYVVKSPSHRTANTKRTIVKVEEVEGAITDGINAGTHVPHFLNYLSLQVKFKFTLSRLTDGKLKITFRFVGKGGESLKDIICLWLRRNDEDKDKIFCEGLTRNKEVTLSILARKFHEIENLKEDIVTLYEEIKTLVPEYRGKEGLRSEDEAFLESYRNLDNKLLNIMMLLYKDNCESDNDTKLLSKFRDLYFSLQISSGFTVKQYLYVIYCYNMIFTPYLPQELEELVKKYASMKNLTLPDSPPLVIPPCGQKSKLTVINPFAKNKLQDDDRENNFVEFEMSPIKTENKDSPKTQKPTEAEKKNVPKKRQTYRRNRRPYFKKNQKNPPNAKPPQNQRNPQNSSQPRNNQFNNRFPRNNRQNAPNQRENSFRQSNVQNTRKPRNPIGQRNQSNNVRNSPIKRQQGTQGGSPAKKRTPNNETIPVNHDSNQQNPTLSTNQETPDNAASRNQNKRNRPRPRPRRKNISNQQNNDNSRNPPRNIQNPRNSAQNPRNSAQNPRNSAQNPRNSAQNPRNSAQNPRNMQNQRNLPNSQNSRNEKNSNERNQSARNSRSRRRSDQRKRNSDQFFSMPDIGNNRMQSRNNQSGQSNNHEFLLNSLRNQNLMQSNMRNQEMGRSQNFPNNDRQLMFNSRNQNFPHENSSRHNNFQLNQPRSLFAQQYFDMPRNQQNFPSNNSGNFSPINSRRPLWSSTSSTSEFAGSSQNYFTGSNNFSNRNNSMNRNSGDMPFSNFNNSRMSFDDDMHPHNFMNSNNQHWDNDFNRGKRKNMRDDWNSKRPKRGI